LHGDQRYDLIEADAQWPDVAYAGNLYSREFFLLCRSRLKPGGIVCTWAPTPRTFATFAASFPHVLGTTSGQVLIGSLEPLPWELSRWRRRVASEAVRAYLGEQGVKEASAIVEDLRPLARLRRPTGLQPNLDLFPRDEFQSPD